MDIELNQQNKQIVWAFWDALQNKSAESAVQAAMSADVIWHGPDPINELQGASAFVSDFWQPLMQAFPDLTRQTHLFCDGKYWMVELMG